MITIVLFHLNSDIPALTPGRGFSVDRKKGADSLLELGHRKPALSGAVANLSANNLVYSLYTLFS